MYKMTQRLTTNVAVLMALTPALVALSLCCRHGVRVGLQRLLLGALRDTGRGNEGTSAPQSAHVSHPLRLEGRAAGDPPPGTLRVTRRRDVREQLRHHGLETLHVSQSCHHGVFRSVLRRGCWKLLFLNSEDLSYNKTLEFLGGCLGSVL